MSLDAPLRDAAFGVWHDRAVFHFLTDPTDRERYVAQARRAVRPGGHIIVASFGLDGPTKCSGLDVVRYSPESMHDEFGRGFQLIDSAREDHHTPAGKVQAFVYCLCRVQPARPPPENAKSRGAPRPFRVPYPSLRLLPRARCGLVTV